MAAQPAPGQPTPGQPVPGQWTTGLFGCVEDPSVCCYGMFCGLCLYGDVTNIVTGGGFMPACMTMYCCPLCTQCCIAPGNRTQMRQLWGQPELPPDDMCNDWVASVCCLGLSLCQQKRELNARGVKQPGDVARQQAQATQAQMTQLQMQNQQMQMQMQGQMQPPMAQQQMAAAPQPQTM